ncbi:hypothetical protein [Marinobacter qingdaonensis]|uniref:Capsule assembly protein Wzi n=1 Tax=Marinobacter qingdaonensis TaxID=3108486 RepID=A0ABU5NYD8_9GAMM|nr:hypothetical protein [Marinobacter sp. ASW11-75]MEA1080814.1 hypothetical protein [Marinobacter sp. ASW11-75]
MTRLIGWWLWGLLSLTAVVGCASRPAPLAPALVSDACEQQFERWHLQVASQGRKDAQAWSPPGFPYLRVDRLLASFELADLSLAQRRDWLSRAHGKARQAWWFEREGGPANASGWLAGLHACSAQAIAELPEDEASWRRLAATVRVPDDYRSGAQIAGLYPLVRPIVHWRATVTMQGLADQFGHYRALGRWRSYGPPETERQAPTAWQRDRLGIPVFEPAALERLFHGHAPVWRIDTRDRHDQPGTPGRGLDGRLRFGLEPVVYKHLGFAYVGGVIQPQLVYQIWFAARPAQSWPDIYAGALDGVVWRVTLDDRGRALVYDSIHPCGCYHQWVLVAGGLRPAAGLNRVVEQVWVLGEVSADGDGPLELSLSAGDHHLVEVQAGAMGAGISGLGKPRTYRLEPLDRLRGRSAAGRRLYRSDGLIAGTERLERFLLWPTGVDSPGAMRQWGRHAVSFTGRRHFDDPHLLDRYFVLP